MTGQRAQTFGAITRTDPPVIGITKPRKPAILGHHSGVTPIYRTVAPTPVVEVVRMICQNDRAIGAKILTYPKDQSGDKHDHYKT